MKKLNQYILEKLTIDKHVTVDPERTFENIFEKMLFLLHMTESYKASDFVKDWLDENKIHTVTAYVKNNKAFEDYSKDFQKVYKDELKQFYIFADKEIGYKNAYTYLNHKLQNNGKIVWQSKVSSGNETYIIRYNKYLGYKPLFSEDLLIFEGNPYGDLG